MGNKTPRYSPREDRTILKMHKDGFSNQEIADRFGKERQTIERRVRLLRKREKAA